MKTSLEDYKTGELKINIDGVDGVVVVHSLASRQWVEGISRYQATLTYAKDNKIELEEESIIELGFDDLTQTVKVKTDFAKKAWAKVMQSIVKDWPFESDLFEALLESEELTNQIDVIGSRLKMEFETAKKT